MKKFFKNNFYIALIIALASILRLFKLGTLPISLFGDEIDVGYHAWSLFSTGRDYMGHFLPSYIQSLSEWRAPLLMYITAPFVGLIGRTPFAVRLPVALLGISSVFLLYLLVKRLFQNEKLALLSALILAITPWHIHYSRASFEVVPLMFLEMLGVYLFISGKEFLSLIPFVLTFYTYSTANIFTPLLLLSLLFIYRPKVWSSKSLPKLIIPALLILPIAYQILFGQAAGRFKLISIFGDQKIIDNLIIQRTDPWVVKTPVETFFHNKYFAYLTAFGENYLSAFSPEFLFLHGDPNFRQSISGQGELLWIFLPFLLMGLYQVISGFKQKSNKLILSWLILAPVASALTQGGGMHATRLFVMLMPLSVITGMGLNFFISKSKNIFLIIAISLLFLFSLGNYWHRYSAHYTYESSEVWQFGYKEIFSRLTPFLNQNKNIYINNTYSPSLIKFAFFTDYPPSKFQKDFHTDNQDSYDTAYFHGFVFDDRFYFGQAKISDLSKVLEPGDIYLAVQGKEVPGDWDWSVSPPGGLKPLGSVKSPLNQPLFYVMQKSGE